MFSTIAPHLKNSFIALILLAINTFGGYSQNYKSIGFETQYGSVIANTRKNQQIVGTAPITFQLRFGETFQDSAFKALYKIELKRGFLLHFTNYNLPILGNVTGLSYFMQPVLYNKNKLKLSFRAVAGIAYASNPYSENNPRNFTYTNYLNNYTSVGIQSMIDCTDNISLSTIIQLNHISNGGFDKPNIGINWLTAGLGVEYKLRQSKEPSWQPSSTSKVFTKHYEVALFYSYPKIDSTVNKSYHVSGISAQIIKRGLLHGWTGGFEFTYDNLYSARVFYKKGLTVPPLLFATHFGHEFLFGNFIFSQQIGIYMVRNYNIYKAPWYHRMGIVCNVNKHLGLGISIKAHLETANFLDARIVWRIK